MSRKASGNAANHGIHHPGSNPRLQRHDRRRAAKARCGAIPETDHAKIDNPKVALSVISVAELAHGIHRANTPERRDSRRAFLDDLKATVPVYPITAETAELVGKINAETSARGAVIPFDDLLIGATALERNYAVATHNERHFKKIPNLTVISV
jgi:tRNA(fMet)-specific endonuclease VapC